MGSGWKLSGKREEGHPRREATVAGTIAGRRRRPRETVGDAGRSERMVGKKGGKWERATDIDFSGIDRA